MTWLIVPCGAVVLLLVMLALCRAAARRNEYLKYLRGPLDPRD